MGEARLRWLIWAYEKEKRRCLNEECERFTIVVRGKVEVNRRSIGES